MDRDSSCHFSLPVALGLETDPTEDDFGVWEVKTMVAVILHLLDGPNGKILALLVTYCQGWVNAHYFLRVLLQTCDLL